MSPQAELSNCAVYLVLFVGSFISGEKMTPYQMLQAEVIRQAIEDCGFKFGEVITAENIENAYETLGEEDPDNLQDIESELREGQERTGVPCDGSRHYESESVAHKMAGGTWIGWTYWFGGGKHGEPESIDWMGDAYFLSCKEEEKTVTVRTFEKTEAK